MTSSRRELPALFGLIMDQLITDILFGPPGLYLPVYRTASPLGRRIYLGGSLEAGEVRNRFDPTTAVGTLYCGSLFFGADTSWAALIPPTAAAAEAALSHHARHGHAVRRTGLFSFPKYATGTTTM